MLRFTHSIKQLLRSKPAPRAAKTGRNGRILRFWESNSEGAFPVCKFSAMTTAIKPTASPSSANPLFPPSQALLWLPGFRGDEQPYCTYNELHGDSGITVPSQDELIRSRDCNGASRATPFPVSRETNICWHTDVRPPYPYHPVPISHTLSPGEMDQLESKVRLKVQETNHAFRDERTVLRNEFKCLILLGLAELGLLSKHVGDPSVGRRTA